MSFVIATEEPDAFEAQVIRTPVSDWELLAIDRYAAEGRAWTANRTPRRASVGAGRHTSPAAGKQTRALGRVNATSPPRRLQGADTSRRDRGGEKRG